MTRRFARRSLPPLAAAVLLGCAACVPAARGQGLPTLEDLPLPPASDLLTRRPQDWVVRTNDDVLISMPVEPRPDTLARLARRRDFVGRMASLEGDARKAEIVRYLRGDEAKLDYRLSPEAITRLADDFGDLPEDDLRRAVRELGGPAVDQALRGATAEAMRAAMLAADRPAFVRRAEELEKVDVTLLDEALEDPAFAVETSKIAQIIHHEDLMLRRADALLGEGDVRTAFELLFKLQRMPSSERLPGGWPGLAEALDKAAFVDAGELLAAGEAEAALGRMELLLDRTPAYPGGVDRLAEAADGLIGAAIEEEDFRRARFFLARLRLRGPDHPVTQRRAGELDGRARSLLAEATAASEAGDHRAAAAAVNAAADVYPRSDGLARTYDRLTNRYQILRAGVLHAAPPEIDADGRGGPFPPGPAADRVKFLLASRLFELDAVDQSPHYRSLFFENWTPTDLGRRASFALRPRFPDWFPQPPLDAAGVLAGLRDRLDPDSPLYDERLAEEIRGVRQLSPTSFEIAFARVPLRTEAVLATPVRVVAPLSTAEESAGAEPPAEIEEAPVTDEPAGAPGELKTPFFPRVTDGTAAPGAATYRRAVPEPDEAAEFHVAEVREIAYPDGPSQLQGFRRGEVDLLVHPRPWDVPGLMAREDVLSFKSSLPATHLLQLNPRSATMKNAELRRALVLALDRRAILDAAVLRTKEARSMGMGRVVSAPFPSFSEATNPLLDPREQDLNLAFALSLAAARSLTENPEKNAAVPPLVVLAPEDEVVRAVLEELAITYERIGLSLEVVTGDAAAERAANGAGGGEGGWDLAYRTLKMREPAREIAPLLTNSDDVSLEALLYLSDWLRRDLIALERAGDRNTAVAILHDLHRHLLSEARVVPLFEVDEYVFASSALRNVAGPLVHPYQGVERWQVVRPLPDDTFGLEANAPQ